MSRDCVSPEEAAALVEGALGGEAAGSIDRHVADCDRCRRLVAAVAADSGGDPTAPDGGGALSAGMRVGRYQLVEAIGRGGMGVVFRARDEVLGRDVAVKLIRLPGADAAARALREARALARLSHPNVVAIHDAGEHDGATFLAMELVPGRSLTAWLAAPRSPAEVIAVIADVARGLGAAHRAGLVHRDVKPANVLVGDDGRSRIADFGLARGAGAAAAPAGVDVLAESLTASRQVIGTPAYMAPEQLDGGEIDARTDQFALAQTAWEALFGAPPFPPAPAGERLAAIRAARFAAIPPDRRAVVPRHVEPALRRALAADPAARHPDLERFTAALAARRWPRRAALAVAGAAAAVAVALVASTGRESPAAATPTPAVPATLLALPTIADLDVTEDGGAAVWKEGNRVVVRGLDGRADAALDVAGPRRLADAVFDGTGRVLLSFDDGSIDAWRPGADGLVTVAPADTGRALGAAADGRIVVVDRGDGASARVRLVGAGGAHVVADLAGKSLIRHGGLSPDRRRLAVVVAGEAQHVVVLDLAAGREIARHPVALAVAVAWRDDAHLLVASGWKPTVVDEHRLDGGALVPTRRVHEVAGGQLTILLGRGGRAFLVEVRADPSVRIHGIGTSREPGREVSGGRAAIGLAWDGGGAPWLWDGGGRQLVRHGLDGTERFVQVGGGAPIGAGTRAGDVLVLGPTRGADCAVIAVALADGVERWRRPGSCKAVVRCAGDVAPPCLRVDWPERDRFEVSSIDPETGEVGVAIAGGTTFPNGLADAALSADGATLAIVSSRSTLRWRAVDGGAERTVDVGGGRMLQWVAIAPDGAAIVASRRTGRPAYELLRVTPEGAVEPLLTSEAEWMQLPRVSPDGARVLVSEQAWSNRLIALDLRPR